MKGSQKLWTRKIPENTQLYTVAGSCCILNIEKVQQQGLWFSIRYCLGKPLHTLQLLLTANEGAGAQAGHAAASKWYSRYYDKTLGLKFYKKSRQLAILFSWKGVQLNKLWQTHRAMLLPLTQVPDEHIQAVRKCYCLTTVEEKKKKKKSSEGTNKENLTQSPINGIRSIYLSMIKCYHCTLIAKFDDDRHSRK